jgi:hypothetical protein
MGIDTYAALTERLSPEQIVERLQIKCGATNIRTRHMRSPDHWVFEFELGRSRFFALEAFLNGLAANDFPELGAEIHTLLSMERGSDSGSLIHNVAAGCEGWFRLTDSVDWTILSVSL